MLGWLLVRLRFAVVLFWAVVALAAYLYLPPIGSSTTSSLSEVVPEYAPAARAQSKADDLAGSVEAPAMLVYSNPEGFTGADLESIRGGIQSLNEGPGRLSRLQRAVPLAVENRSDPTQVDRGLSWSGRLRRQPCPRGCSRAARKAGRGPDVRST
jgi:putative drug exporter of the RND superfamily